jgi:hypothetical protein
MSTFVNIFDVSTRGEVAYARTWSWLVCRLLVRLSLDTSADWLVKLNRLNAACGEGLPPMRHTSFHGNGSISASSIHFLCTAHVFHVSLIHAYIHAPPLCIPRAPRTPQYSPLNATHLAPLNTRPLTPRTSHPSILAP